jgi:capsular exopolysaccharide synthesis family protein
MSQIFDALQRSEAERTGIDLGELSDATELVKVAERSTAQRSEVERTRISSEELSNAMDLLKTAQRAAGTGIETKTAIAEITPADQQTSHSENQYPEFESLPVSISPDSRLVCLTDRDSLAAEKFRLLGVRLRQLQHTKPLKKVLITSAIPNEGKSMVAANLACTLARKKQQKVLLVDGDLRRPSLAGQFGVGRIPGLSEFLQNEQDLSKTVYRLDSASLWFVPGGSATQNALELMQASALTSFMGDMAARFDWIIVDTPPMLPLADTSVWARLVDGILLVSRRAICEKKQLEKTLEAVDQSKLLGTIINSSVEANQNDYYYNHYGPKPKKS